MFTMYSVGKRVKVKHTTKKMSFPGEGANSTNSVNIICLEFPRSTDIISASRALRSAVEGSSDTRNGCPHLQGICVGFLLVSQDPMKFQV